MATFGVQIASARSSRQSARRRVTAAWATRVARVVAATPLVAPATSVPASDGLGVRAVSAASSTRSCACCAAAETLAWVAFSNATTPRPSRTDHRMCAEKPG
ncbi:hypothetical protein DEJ30_11730 [Curtobacterium sp. MCPF17_003]|nr:hypothetical protein DEJ30_11730 [Curtobacterium sp. MCPF17_003]